MGYRSQVYLKTVTEGYLMLKRANDKEPYWENKTLSHSIVQRTPTGNYKIIWDDIKWYDSYTQIQNVNKVLEQMDEQGIPYSFIRIGEEPGDVEHKRSYPDDMPYEIETFEPIVDVNDEDFGVYIDHEDYTHSS